jgi:hypothetical protein
VSDHGARSHATWSASATARNIACPGSLTLASRVKAVRTSEAAAWGTACHQVAEQCLRGRDPSDFLGETVEVGKRSFEFDEEMVETTRVFVDYVRNRTNYVGIKLWIEEHFSLADLNPPFDAGGTCDAVIYDPEKKRIEVIDLKAGRGVVVEAVGNDQLRTYALGAMLAHPGLDVEQVMVTIIQPRAPHKDGRIRSETFHVVDLVEWTADLVKAMQQSRHAMLLASPYNDMPIDPIWARDWLRAGDHCKFCPAAGFCPALRQQALDAAGVWFDDSDQPRISNSPDAMSPEELAQALNAADVIGEWINAVRAFAHQQAESGVIIPGYVLVDKIGHRAWKVDEATVVSQMLTGHHDLSVDQLYTRKLVSPAQAEKLLGSKRKDLIADLVERPVRGTNLVAADKTTREPTKSTAERYFETVN